MVVDPNNGEILAMASVPSFDPNTFIPSIKAKDWEELRKAEADPLINRAVSAFPPGLDLQARDGAGRAAQGSGNARSIAAAGSAMAIISSSAGLRKKAARHGTLGLSDAIKVSCNSYFYQFGNAAGIDAIDETGETLGLGKATGVEITGRTAGRFCPGPEWMRIHYPSERWTSAYTANVSIGQGYDLVSPLQLAMVYATVANGGVSYQPRLVQSVVDAGRQTGC